ncbi:MAG: response regulator [Cyclobacteriaceae bacterium]
MIKAPLNLLLADDDIDDCFFFRVALEEKQVSVNLTIVNDGDQLIQLISAKGTPIPDALFLDLNMPRKNGIECLSEIRSIDKLASLPIFIYSTSLSQEVVDLLYEKGAKYYICKPGEFNNLKKVLSKAVTIISQKPLTQPSRDKFILEP